MQQLQIAFRDTAIEGSGVDLIAPFTLSGNLRTGGAITFVKQYLGRHSVLYVGQHDGEGTFFGTWDIDGYRGQWSIKVTEFEQRSEAADDLYDEVL